jgi:hypothetical protein
MTQQFDLFAVINVACLDVFGDCAIERPLGRGHTVAQMLVPGEHQMLVSLAHASFFEAEADLILVGTEKGGDGVGDFYEFGGGGFIGRDGVEHFHDAGGSDAGGAPGEGAGAETGEIPGVFGEVFVAGEGFLFLLPAFEAAGAPLGEVLFANGHAIELGGEDFFDAHEAVEPGEDVGGGLVVFEAAVELFADGFGEAGDFAEGHRGKNVEGSRF